MATQRSHVNQNGGNNSTLLDDAATAKRNENLRKLFQTNKSKKTTTASKLQRGYSEEGTGRFHCNNSNSNSNVANYAHHDGKNVQIDTQEYLDMDSTAGGPRVAARQQHWSQSNDRIASGDALAAAVDTDYINSDVGLRRTDSRIRRWGVRSSSVCGEARRRLRLGDEEGNLSMGKRQLSKSVVDTNQLAMSSNQSQLKQRQDEEEAVEQKEIKNYYKGNRNNVAEVASQRTKDYNAHYELSGRSSSKDTLEDSFNPTVCKLDGSAYETPDTTGTGLGFSFDHDGDDDDVVTADVLADDEYEPRHSKYLCRTGNQRSDAYIEVRTQTADIWTQERQEAQDNSVTLIANTTRTRNSAEGDDRTKEKWSTRDWHYKCSPKDQHAKAECDILSEAPMAGDNSLWQAADRWDERGSCYNERVQASHVNFENYESSKHGMCWRQSQERMPNDGCSGISTTTTTTDTAKTIMYAPQKESQLQLQRQQQQQQHITTQQGQEQKSYSNISTLFKTPLLKRARGQSVDRFGAPGPLQNSQTTNVHWLSEKDINTNIAGNDFGRTPVAVTTPAGKPQAILVSTTDDVRLRQTNEGNNKASASCNNFAALDELRWTQQRQQQNHSLPQPQLRLSCGDVRRAWFGGNSRWSDYIAAPAETVFQSANRPSLLKRIELTTAADVGAGAQQQSTPSLLTTKFPNSNNNNNNNNNNSKGKNDNTAQVHYKLSQQSADVATFDDATESSSIPLTHCYTKSSSPLPSSSLLGKQRRLVLVRRRNLTNGGGGQVKSEKTTIDERQRTINTTTKSATATQQQQLWLLTLLHWIGLSRFADYVAVQLSICNSNNNSNNNNNDDNNNSYTKSISNDNRTLHTSRRSVASPRTTTATTTTPTVADVEHIPKRPQHTFDVMAILRSMKLKDRLAISLGATLILLTLLLVVDVQMDFGVTNRHLLLQQSRVRYVNENDAGGGGGLGGGGTGTFRDFKRKFLQKSNSSGSKETATPTTTQSRPAGTAAGGNSADVAAGAAAAAGAGTGGGGSGGAQQDAAAREDMLAIKKQEREPHDPFDDLLRLLSGLDKTDYSHVLIDDDGSVVTENPTFSDLTGMKPSYVILKMRISEIFFLESQTLLQNFLLTTYGHKLHSSIYFNFYKIS
ncbi:unnamed protein product [Ceratitis capitata]|uniref:(Mediterranean fruit fly) hypothetical protein n=1 Tax=Ceratitis capitata TaxID=7213 RepID=A0A811U4X9_CERCA|nr:unnamed protein product [Ceratitis capitata]